MGSVILLVSSGSENIMSDISNCGNSPLIDDLLWALYMENIIIPIQGSEQPFRKNKGIQEENCVTWKGEGGCGDRGSLLHNWVTNLCVTQYSQAKQNDIYVCVSFNELLTCNEGEALVISHANDVAVTGGVGERGAEPNLKFVMYCILCHPGNLWNLCGVICGGMLCVNLLLANLLCCGKTVSMCQAWRKPDMCNGCIDTPTHLQQCPIP